MIKNAPVNGVWYLALSACLLPAIYLISALLIIVLIDPFYLGAEPGETITHLLGHYSFIFLLVVLSITPIVKHLHGFKRLMVYRRMIGLTCFFYVSLHLLAYAAFYLGFDIKLLLEETVNRPYLIFGGVAWLLLLPLAISSKKSIRRSLGSKRWRKLHQFSYLICALAVIHVLLQIRSDWMMTASYVAIIIVIALLRIVPPRIVLPRKRRNSPSTTQNQ